MRRHRKRVAALAVLGLVLATLGVVLPGEGALGATSPKPPTRPVVTGWLPYWSSSTSTSAVTQNADLFREASPFFFSTRSVTGVSRQGTAAALQGMVSSLHGRGLQVIPTFTTSMSADTFAALLRHPKQRTAHVRAIVKTAAAAGVDGVDLDYEAINFGSTAARNVVRSKYPLLVHQLDTALARRGMVSAVTVPARRSDSDPNWWVYNYGALGAAADRFRIMTYDYSWSGGSPGPIAPKAWVDQVLAYAVTRVPPSHISFGLPAYGRDWYVRTVKGSCPASAKSSLSRTSSQMQAFVNSRGIATRWNVAGTSRTFTYRQHYTSGGHSCVAKREAWFDDARSYRAKLSLVAKYHLRGVAVWALGDQTPGMWQSMRSFAVANAVQPAAVKVTAPRVVTYGSQARVAGQVSVSGSPARGVGVELWRRTDGGAWTRVDRRTSGAGGAVSFTVSPHNQVQYRLSTPRTWSHAAAQSTAAGTRVSYRIALDTSRPETTVPGRTFSLGGRVTPAQAGVVTRLQVKRAGHWVTRNTDSVGTRGRFSLTVHVKGPGKRTVRVVAARGDLARATSRALQVTFR